MSFLEEFDGMPDDDSRAQLFFQRLATDWRGLFAELRRDRPLLNIKQFVVVTRWADVTDALSRAHSFHVPYADKMNDSVGPFMLGCDDSVQNWRDKAVMRTLLRWDDLASIRRFAGETAKAALYQRTESASVDIPKTVSRLVPLRVVQRFFGFPGPSDAAMLRWSKATQTDMFRNLEGDKKIHGANLAAGQEMRQWIRYFLSERQPWSDARGEDTVSRLLRLTASGLSGFNTEEVVSNICGLLVGAVETTSNSIVNATEQILLRPRVLERAVAAARLDDTTLFDSLVWEALRFNPMAKLIMRVAAEPAILAPGTAYALPVNPPRMIAAAIGSAMFDGSVFTDPDTFQVRQRSAYLHMGFGMHECLGKFIAFMIVPETVRQIVSLPGIHLLGGEEGQIDSEGGVFPERFVVGITSLNEVAINSIVNSTAARPYPFSLWSPAAGKPAASYVSWTGLVDRTFTGRHLPPADQSVIEALPPVEKVVELFHRETMVPCERSSALFCFFAQWFTDSFLRTDPKDWRKNTSNHEIDLCQIYGLDATTTDLLRAKRGGRMRMQPQIPFPEHLYKGRKIRKDFLSLPYVGKQEEFEAVLTKLFKPAIEEPGRRNTLYALGLGFGNATVVSAAISVLFLREHNWICGELERRYPDWDNDRYFETARNINIASLLRIIVEEYINHLAGGRQPGFQLQLNFAEKQRWYRTNRISLEFNLLYRWHSLVPNSLVVADETLQPNDMRFNNPILERHGIELVIDQASRQHAGRIGLGNSPSFLIDAEIKAHGMARQFRLQSYNAYRKCFGLPCCKTYDELTGDFSVSEKLRALYGNDVNRVELLVGLLAEKRAPGAIFPDLMRTMVGVDAFSQALTNPLLSNNVYGKDAFSEVGLGIIDRTRSLADVVARNSVGAPPNHVTFDITKVAAADRLTSS